VEGRNILFDIAWDVDRGRYLVMKGGRWTSRWYDRPAVFTFACSLHGGLFRGCI